MCLEQSERDRSGYFINYEMSEHCKKKNPIIISQSSRWQLQNDEQSETQRYSLYHVNIIKNTLLKIEKGKNY